MNDEELLQLLSERPNYKAPELYDAELDALITERSRQTVQLRKERYIWIIIASATLGGLAGFTGVYTGGSIPYSVIIWLILAYCGFGYVVGLQRAAAVTKSFNSGRHDLTAKLLPGAVWWNTKWYPVTTQQLLKCQHIELQMLIHEGRILELEAHSRFLMVQASASKAWSKRFLPRLQNNLWLCYMFAGRYREAADGFVSFDTNKVEQMMRPIILINLALCQVKGGDAHAAQETLNKAFAEIGNKPQDQLRSRLQYIQASVYLEQDDLPGAEAALEKARPLAEKIASRELQAECMVLTGRLLRKQKRYDEAALFFKSAIEIFSSTDNTHFLGLCFAMHYYAQMLLESGDEKAALKLVRKIVDYLDSYQKREENTMERLKHRLRESTSIRCVSDLLTTSERAPLLELGTIEN